MKELYLEYIFSSFKMNSTSQREQAVSRVQLAKTAIEAQIKMLQDKIVAIGVWHKRLDNYLRSRVSEWYV